MSITTLQAVMIALAALQFWMFLRAARQRDKARKELRKYKTLWVVETLRGGN